VRRDRGSSLFWGGVWREGAVEVGKERNNVLL